MNNVNNSSTRRQVFKGISSQSFVSISTGIIEIISFSIMSRLLTKEDFGYYAAIMAIVTVFSSFSETGIGSAIIQKKNIDKSFINTAFTLSLIFGIIISSALFFLSGTIAETIADISMKVPLMLMSITLLLYCLTSVNTSIMYRELQFMKVGIIQLFSSIITTVIAVILALCSFGYYAIIAKAVITSLSTWILTSFFVKTRFKIEFNKNKARSIIGYSGWLMASVIFRNLSTQADRLLMPNLLSVSLLGAYNRPKDFINQISGRINGIFDIVFFPLLSGMQDNLQKLRIAFNESLYYLSMLSAALFLVFVINSELIVRIFLGENWMELKSLLQILSIIFYVNTIGRMADCYLRSLALTRTQFIFRLIETISKFLCVVIGSSWGIMGVAISVVLTDAILKTLKLTYIALKIKFNLSEMIRVIFVSLKFTIYFIPVIILYFIIPSTMMGNLFMMSIVILTLFVVFLFFPQCVGMKYKEEMYSKVINYISSFRKEAHL